MAAFEYRASDRSGSVQRGVESAADLQSAARALRARGLTPIVLKPAGSSALYAPAGGSATASRPGHGRALAAVSPRESRLSPSLPRARRALVGADDAGTRSEGP